MEARRIGLGGNDNSEIPRRATRTHLIERRGVRGSAALLLVAHFLCLAGPADGASNVIQYTYDAAGNIVQMQRGTPAPVTITSFSPASGPIGTVVTIEGAGFSPSPSGNVVTFNGVQAPATSSTATSIVVPVPPGATTGKIAVTVGANTATSVQDFVVAAAGAPTITGFSPTGGGAGTLVTVTGTNFNPAANATTLKLNATGAAVSSVTASQLNFSVPASTGSGSITVTTSQGTGVSASDFVVPPTGIALSNIIAIGRVTANGPAQTLSILTPSKYGLMLFDGSAGDWLSLQLSNFAVNPAGGSVAFTVYRPDNTVLSSGTLSTTNLSIHLPQLPASGTYGLLLSPGTSTVATDIALKVNAAVTADGSVLSRKMGVGQSERLVFTGAAGQNLGLGISNLVLAPSTVATAYVYVFRPDGTILLDYVPCSTTTSNGPGCSLNLNNLLVAGTYSVLVASLSGATGSFNIQLNSDVTGALTTNVARPVTGMCQ